MTRGKAHSASTRANAQALLLAGHTQADVARETGLPKMTVSRIAAGLGEQLVRIGTQKTESDADLIMGYFRGVLRALTAQTEVFGDPAYCRTQDADKLAIAHGILGDKLAGIATTAQTLGLIGHPIDHYDALPGPAPAAAPIETVDATPGPG